MNFINGGEHPITWNGEPIEAEITKIIFCSENVGKTYFRFMRREKK